MNKISLYFLAIVVAIGSLVSDAQTKKAPVAQSKPKVTFIELGSVNCIPCKKMQPVMKAIEAKYGGEVKVIFYDVWTDAHKPYAAKYGIRLIPTQVFLDERGNEFFRHEGFFPEKEIDRILREKGVQSKS